jgi:protein-S-isoprenylcysteine O-methyltransferase Ste14
MASQIVSVSQLDAGPPESAETFWKKMGGYLVRRRVRISLIVFAALIAEDVLESAKPHDLANLRDVKTLIGLSLILGGLALRSWAAGILRKQAQVTTGGPYALVRHPLYIGSFMMMLGFCALIDDAENIWFVLGPFAILYFMRIVSEERALLKRFGARWEEYTRRVPRFLPRRLRPEVLARWTLDQWARNHEYRAVGAALAGLVAIEMWRIL